MSAAFDRLRGYFASKGSAFTDEEFAILQSTFTPAGLPADGFLQRSGELATHAVFVVSGVLRVYTIDLNGREHIVQFVPEDWWWSDAASIMSGSPSQYFAQAIEPTELLLTDLPSHRRLLKDLPPFAAAFTAGVQRHNAAKDQRIVSALSATAEERYTAFVAKYPSIVQRVPQWMIASYLGLSPETLSRIRKNLSRRARAR